MAISVLDRLGLDQAGGGPLDLFLTVAADLLRAFDRDTMTEGIFMTRKAVTGAKTAQFPIMGRTTVSRFAAGDNIVFAITEVGNQSTYQAQIPRTEKLVHIDRPLLTSSTHDLLDQSMEQVDYREAIIAEHVGELSRAVDFQRFVKLCQGAGTWNGTVFTPRQANLTGPQGTASGHGIVMDITGGTGLDVLKRFWEMRRRFNRAYVPPRQRYAFLIPELYEKIMSDETSQKLLTDVDYYAYNPNGSLGVGIIQQYAGWAIMESTNIPSTNLTSERYSGAGNITSENDYTGFFEDHQAVFAHATALGTATIGEVGIDFDSGYERLYRADVNIAAWTGGMEWLRPEACGVLIDHV